MQIPLVDLKAQYKNIKPEMDIAIQTILDQTNFISGKEIDQFEQHFSEFVRAKGTLGVASGTAAIQLSLIACGIGPRDEVITTAHTFAATSEAILHAGAKPVFVDIDPQTYLMDVKQVEAKINSHTKAILPVHLYGQTVDMDPLRELADKYHLMIIEDACQAHGARYKGKRAGALGDAAAFSFYFSKNLGGYGEGGFITTRNEQIAQKVRLLRDHGSHVRYQHDLVGYNSRPDELQAVVLRAKLPHLEEWNQKRRQHAALYNVLLANLPVITPVAQPENEHVYHLYVIRAPKRDKLQMYLKEHGIFTGIHYPIPIHLQKAVSNLGYVPGDLPVTEKITGEILSLPMYAELEDQEIEFIVNNIKSFYQ